MSLRKPRKWLVKASHSDTEKSAQVEKISKELGLCPPTVQLLLNRGCTDSASCVDFLEKKTEQLHDPFLMKDMEKAASHILEVAKSKKKIVIYGDYDVDGVTSVSILYMYLASIGADVGYYIPSRLGEGYGMSHDSLCKLHSEGCSMIITVDTGITATEEAKLIRSLGMELIITDHHECYADVPDAYAVVNPKQQDCPYPFKELAGVGVVFKLLCALEMLNRPEVPRIDTIRAIADKYVDLVAIGTVADVMPLRDENRLIVSKGLHTVETAPRVSLEALLNASVGDNRSGHKHKITSGYIGYTIAPRVNAAGRIRSASIAVELFLCEDSVRARELAEELCEINKERQIEENKIIEQAFAKINEEHDFVHDPVIVLADESWHHGIIGIVASKITEKYSRPCILISFDDVGDGSGELSGEDTDVGKGSGRSIKGMNLVDALTHCGDLLLKYGGHELAAGLSIERGKLEDFKQRINDFARGCFDSEQPVAALEAECELSSSEVTMAQATELYGLEPYGVSNPMPVFVMYGMRISHVSSVGGGKHTKLTLAKDNLVITAMYFRYSPAELDVYDNDVIDVMFNLDINEYQSMKNLQFIVKDIRLTKEQAEAEARERDLYARINDSSFDPSSMSAAEIDSIIPNRNDFAAIYNLLKKELRMDHDTFSIRAICKLLTNNGVPNRYVKVKYIIRVFQELNILGVDEVDPVAEIYRF
ncbi:MAG: single-stranded-DNA-specific exonuclease RecJ, partial [Clostridia bacterium]|nr:single-stranded-DNA-specific exonuclease RecJ [Clostridia bacterium]